MVGGGWGTGYVQGIVAELRGVNLGKGSGGKRGGRGRSVLVFFFFER